MKQLNVTVFGDSIAKGLKLVNGKPVKLSINAIEILSQQLKLNITNESSFGQTIKRLKEKKIIEKYLQNINKKQKNVVVFCIGGNDSDYDWVYVNQHFDEQVECKTPLNEFILTYTELIKKLKKRKVKVYICGLPPVSAEKFFENYICKIANKNNILNFFKGDISNIVRHQEIYHNALKELAFNNGCLFLDIRIPFLQVRDLPFYYAEDGLHPNEIGHKIIADFLLEKFARKK